LDLTNWERKHNEGRKRRENFVRPKERGMTEGKELVDMTKEGGVRLFHFREMMRFRRGKKKMGPVPIVDENV